MGGGIIHDTQLQPERRQLQAQAIVDDACDVLRLAEYVDDVDLFAGAEYLAEVVEVAGVRDAVGEALIPAG